MVYARGAPRGQSLSVPSQPQARGIMPPFLLLLGRPPGADAGSAFLPTRCSCCHLGSTQLLEEVGETPQGASGFATGPELCGGRPHPEGRVTGKLRLKNKTRSPQPSARSRRWGSGGAGDGHAADPRVRGCRTVSDVSVADPHTSALTCSGRERPKGGQQRQVADMPGASRELPG